MRSHLRWLAVHVLGWSSPPPKPRPTIREDVNNVGYFLMAGGSGAKEPSGISNKRAQREYLDWVESL